MSNPVEVQDFNERMKQVRLNLRQWPTWKLSHSMDLHSGTTPWDRMSDEDKKYNVAFNKLTAKIREFSVEDLGIILTEAENLK